MRRIVILALLGLSFFVFSTQARAELPDYKSWPNTFSTVLDIELHIESGQKDVVLENVTMYFNTVNAKEASQVVADIVMTLNDMLQHLVQHVIIIGKENDEISFLANLYKEAGGELHLVASKTFSMSEETFYHEMLLDRNIQ